MRNKKRQNGDIKLLISDTRIAHSQKLGNKKNFGWVKNKFIQQSSHVFGKNEKNKSIYSETEVFLSDKSSLSEK